MTRLPFLLAALLLSAACQTVTPEERAELSSAAAQSQTDVLTGAMEPGIAACLAFATTGTLDTALLSRAGFVGPRMALGRPIYEKGDVDVVLNAGETTCRVSWLGGLRTAPVGTSLTTVMRRAGYSRSGANGNRGVFAGPGGPLEVQAGYTQSGAVRSWDVIFFR